MGDLTKDVVAEDFFFFLASLPPALSLVGEGDLDLDFVLLEMDLDFVLLEMDLDFCFFFGGEGLLPPPPEEEDSFFFLTGSLFLAAFFFGLTTNFAVLTLLPRECLAAGSLSLFGEDILEDEGTGLLSDCLIVAEMSQSVIFMIEDLLPFDLQGKF